MRPSLRTRSRTTFSHRSYFSRHPSEARPVKPQSFQLSSSRLNALFVLAVVMMVSGLALGWGIVRSPLFVHHDIDTTAAHLRSSHPGYASEVRSSLPQDTNLFSSTDVSPDVSPAVTPVPSPTLDPHLLMAHVDTGVYLMIPALDLYVPVETTSVGADGRLQMPLRHQWDGVGWYSGGPYPGQQGSSVINGSPAVFDKLAQLHFNDKVSVVDQLGATIDFRVLTVQTYAPDQAPVRDIFGDNSGVYLNLITSAINGTHGGQQIARQIVVHTIIDS